MIELMPIRGHLATSSRSCRIFRNQTGQESGNPAYCMWTGVNSSFWSSLTSPILARTTHE